MDVIGFELENPWCIQVSIYYIIVITCYLQTAVLFLGTGVRDNKADGAERWGYPHQSCNPLRLPTDYRKLYCELSQ